MILNSPTRVSQQGMILALALADQGLLYVPVRTDHGRQLVGLNHHGKVLWELDLQGCGNYPSSVPTRQLRVAEDGSVWCIEENRLTHISHLGERLGHCEIAANYGECLGSFLLLPDGFVGCFVRAPSCSALDGRVVRMDWEGNTLWSTLLPAGQVEYAGIVEMRADTGWQMRSKSPWKPRDWQPSFHEPLLLSEDRLLVSYFELGSGIGCSYCLDAENGKLLWVTERRPEASLAIRGRREFLIGAQGYGAFDTYLYAQDGTVRTHWPSHGYLVLTEEGEIRGVEMENSLPSEMHFCVYQPDGGIRKGPHLEGYYTSYPVVNRAGVVMFFRQGTLWMVDRGLTLRALWQMPDAADEAVFTRLLLANDGTLVFGAGSELLFFRSELGPMARSAWPCEGGNLRNNPV